MTHERGEQLRASLRSAWSGVLGLGEFADDDDFFVLGGHSLLVLSVVDQVARESGVSIPLQAFFAAPTINGIIRSLAA